ncbi:hypothetical protein AAMO2058_000247700 [Amorphochlora amoebiformis]
MGGCSYPFERKKKRAERTCSKKAQASFDLFSPTKATLVNQHFSRMSSSKNEARVSLPFKVVIVGDQAVGKSSLVSRFAKGIFDPNQESTVGAAFYAKDVVVKGKGKRKVSTGGQMKGQEQKQDKIRIELWDTAGQVRYTTQREADEDQIPRQRET